MKTQTYKNNFSKLLLMVLGSLVLLNTACQKKGGGGASAVPVPPPVVNHCVGASCTGSVALYGAPPEAPAMGLKSRAVFEVFGDHTGFGPATLTGTISFDNYLCGNGVLSGSFPLQVQGSVYEDVFTGILMLPVQITPVFGGGMFQVTTPVTIVPTRYKGTGYFRLEDLCGMPSILNY